MRAEAVIETVVNAGGELILSGDRIRYKIPKNYPGKEHILDQLREHKDEVLQILRKREEIPAMPPGVLLIRWEPKPAPLLLARYAVVTDVVRFISITLLELEAALAGKRWQAGHWSVRELVDRLEQCGVYVQIERVEPAGRNDLRSN